MWRSADYLITSFVFVLIGFELTAMLETSHGNARTVLITALVFVVLVTVRFDLTSCVRCRSVSASTSARGLRSVDV